MSLNTATPVVSAWQYETIFAREQAQVYPMVDAFEERVGFAIATSRLEAAARVLSCPFKAAPPNWQHGRVIYAAARRYAADYLDGGNRVRVLDIGTAKGFSALCLLWGFLDAGEQSTCEVTSVDVMHPEARVRRNTPAEVDGLKTLAEILAPWADAQRIRFEQATGIDWLKRHPDRIRFAFVDGKHDGSVVLKEGKLLADRQEAGDVVIFDDIQVPSVGQAVASLDPYEVEYLQVLPGRKYGIGVRR